MDNYLIVGKVIKTEMNLTGTDYIVTIDYNTGPNRRETTYWMPAKTGMIPPVVGQTIHMRVQDAGE